MTYGSYGLTRGLAVLLAAAASGALLWASTQGTLGGQSAYWSAVGLLAVAGAVFALAQSVALARERTGFSLGVFLLGFVPVLVVAGWIVSAAAPGGSYAVHFQAWTRDIHVSGFVAPMQTLWPLLAFAVGLVFGLSFRSEAVPVEVVDEDPGRAYAAAGPSGADGFSPRPVNTPVNAPVTAPASASRAATGPSADAAAIASDVSTAGPERRGLLSRRFSRAELRRERVPQP